MKRRAAEIDRVSGIDIVGSRPGRGRTHVHLVEVPAAVDIDPSGEGLPGGRFPCALRQRGGAWPHRFTTAQSLRPPSRKLSAAPLTMIRSRMPPSALSKIFTLRKPGTRPGVAPQACWRLELNGRRMRIPRSGAAWRRSASCALRQRGGACRIGSRRPNLCGRRRGICPPPRR
jgi:hypothetical protein